MTLFGGPHGATAQRSQEEMLNACLCFGLRVWPSTRAQSSSNWDESQGVLLTGGGKTGGRTSGRAIGPDGAADAEPGADAEAAAAESAGNGSPGIAQVILPKREALWKLPSPMMGDHATPELFFIA